MVKIEEQFPIYSWVKVKAGYEVHPYFSKGERLQIVGHQKFIVSNEIGLLLNISDAHKGPFYAYRFEQPEPFKLDVKDWL